MPLFLCFASLPLIINATSPLRARRRDVYMCSLSCWFVVVVVEQMSAVVGSYIPFHSERATMERISSYQSMKLFAFELLKMGNLFVVGPFSALAVMVSCACRSVAVADFIVACCRACIPLPNSLSILVCCTM